MTRYAVILGPDRRPICGLRMKPGDPREDLRSAWELATICGCGCDVEVVRMVDGKQAMAKAAAA
jgi:hypothetical protein